MRARQQSRPMMEARRDVRARAARYVSVSPQPTEKPTVLAVIGGPDWAWHVFGRAERNVKDLEGVTILTSSNADPDRVTIEAQAQQGTAEALAERVREAIRRAL